MIRAELMAINKKSSAFHGSHNVSKISISSETGCYSLGKEWRKSTIPAAVTSYTESADSISGNRLPATGSRTVKSQ